MTDLLEPVLWENAKVYLREIGIVPATFTTTVRFLRQNQQKNSQDGSRVFTYDSKFQMGRLLKSNALMSPFFHVTQLLHPQSVKKAVGYSREQFLKLHTPGDVASILTILFLARRLKLRALPEEWPWIEKHAQELCDVGCLLGQRLDQLGVADAMLCGAMRHLSLGVLSLPDVKPFQQYRRTMKQRGILFDLPLEVATFQTTHVHVGSILLQMIGHGVPISDSFSMGLLAGPKDKLESGPSRFRILGSFIDALYRGVPPPPIVDESQYSVSDEDIDFVVDEVGRIRTNGTISGWISKRKSEIGADITPQILFDEHSGDEAEPGDLFDQPG